MLTKDDNNSKKSIIFAADFGIRIINDKQITEMTDLELQKIIDQSPLYTLLWEWMNDLRPEEAENPGDGYAFMATNGTMGPRKIFFCWTIYEHYMKGEGYLYGPLSSNCYFTPVGRGLTVNVGRPYYYQYAIEYALLYMDDEERQRQQALYDDLAQRMARIHPRAFADLELRLGMFRHPGRFAAELLRLRQEVAQRPAPPMSQPSVIAPSRFPAPQPVVPSRAIAPQPIIAPQPTDTYATSLTRRNCVHYIATRHNEDRAEACIEMLEALLPKEEHEQLRDDIEQERIDCEQRKQKRRSRVQPSPPAPVQYNVSGDLVMEKHVEREVAYVASGGIGING